MRTDTGVMPPPKTAETMGDIPEAGRQARDRPLLGLRSHSHGPHPESGHPSSHTVGQAISIWAARSAYFVTVPRGTNMPGPARLRKTLCAHKYVGTSAKPGQAVSTGKRRRHRRVEHGCPAGPGSGVVLSVGG